MLLPLQYDGQSTQQYQAECGTLGMTQLLGATTTKPQSEEVIWF